MKTHRLLTITPLSIHLSEPMTEAQAEAAGERWQSANADSPMWFVVSASIRIIQEIGIK